MHAWFPSVFSYKKKTDNTAWNFIFFIMNRKKCVIIKRINKMLGYILYYTKVNAEEAKCLFNTSLN